MSQPIDRRRVLALAGAGVAGAVGNAGAALAGVPAAAAAQQRPERRRRSERPERPLSSWPRTLRLPDGFRPEGIAIAPATPHAYFGSLGNGWIYRADLRTGAGLIVSKGPGSPAVGLELDVHGRLFVAGGEAGNGWVLDTGSGAVLASYQFGSADTSFVNDVTVLGNTVWFTDSFNAELYALRLGPRGALPGPGGVVRLPLRGEWEQDTHHGVYNANGICTTPDGSALLVAHWDTGIPYRVDPSTGHAVPVDFGDNPPPSGNGDGLLMHNGTLYVVRNLQNAVDVLELDATGRTGSFRTRITDDRFDIPTTASVYRDRLYLPNARFTTDPTPETPYTAVSVPVP